MGSSTATSDVGGRTSRCCARTDPGSPTRAPPAWTIRTCSSPTRTGPGGWHKRLSLPAKAALLIARSFALQKDFYLPIESAPRQFGISADTLGDGVRELRDHSLLERRPEYEPDPLSALGYRLRYRYKLRPPFDQPAGSNTQPAAPAAAPAQGSP